MANFFQRKRNELWPNCYAVNTLCLLTLLVFASCGTTRQNSATEQLLLSDAVDRSVARIDFSPLSGKKVYLDTQYIQPVKSSSFVNSEYIVSSLRQQMMATRCLLQERRDDAEFIVEARVGALGSDGHDVSYGIPANSTLNSAMTLVPNSPALPALPELSVAKKTEDLGAAKVAAFAYHRETREPYWQSGISQARSTAKYRWLFGAGPFQSGTIFKGPRFAGRKLNVLDSAERERSQEHRDEVFRTAAIWPAKTEGAADQRPMDDEVEELLAAQPKEKPINDNGKSVPEGNAKESPVRLANHEESVPPVPPSKAKVANKADPAPPSTETTESPAPQPPSSSSTSESANPTTVQPDSAAPSSEPPAGWLDSFRRFGTRVNGLF